jgi:hypothetical protein
VILSVSTFDLTVWYCQYQRLISLCDIVSINVWSHCVILSVFFPLISLCDIVSINVLTMILENRGQCDITLWRLINDKNNNVSIEDLNIHYHNSSYQICCNTSDNVCLDFQNCLYSIFIGNIIMLWKESLNSDGQQFHQYKKKLSPQLTEYKKDHKIWLENSGSRLGQAQKCGRLNQLMDHNPPLLSVLMIGSSTTIHI